MRSNPVKRFASIFLKRWPVVILSSAIGLFIQLLAGLTTPATYYSEATLAIEAQTQQNSQISVAALGGNSEGVSVSNTINRVVMMARTTEVMSAVYKKLKLNGFEFYFAFPKSNGALTAEDRLNLLALRIDRFVRVPHVKFDNKFNVDENGTIGLLRRQLIVSPNPEERQVAFGFEALTPFHARAVTDSVVEVLLEAFKERAVLDLKSAEQYMMNALVRLRDEINLRQNTMFDIGSRSPEALREGGADSVDDYVRLTGQLKALEREGATNALLLDKLAKVEAASASDLELAKAATQKISEEVADLEFRYFDLTKVRGYAEDDPQLKKLKGRLTLLKGLYRTAVPKTEKTLETDGGAMGYYVPQNKEQVQATMNQLASRSLAIISERRLLAAEVAKLDKSRKSGIKDSFTVQVLRRESSAYERVANEMEIELSRLRIRIASVVSPLSLASRASTPYISSSISLNKRMFFGLMVGAAVALTALFGFDLVSPSLFSLSELAGAGWRVLDVVAIAPATVNRASALLATLKRSPNNRASLVAIHPVYRPDVFDRWIREVVHDWSRRGEKIAMVVVSDEDVDGIRRKSAVVDDIEFTWLHRDDLPFAYGPMVERLKGSVDRILVVAFDLHGTVWQHEVDAHADSIVIVTKLGVNMLADVQTEGGFGGRDVERAALVAA